MQRGFVNWSNTQGVSLKNKIHNFLQMDSKRAYEEAEKELEENFENDVRDIFILCGDTASAFKNPCFLLNVFMLKVV